MLEIKPVRLGLIGIGGFAGVHLSVIEALARNNLAQLIAVADPGMERFPDIKSKLEANGARCYANHLDMLKAEERLEAVTIAAPIPYHFDMTLACIERGLFVYLEKPPVPLIQQLESLILADTSSRVCVGFQMITLQSMQRLKSMILEGNLGEIREIRAACCWPRMDRYYQRAGWAGKLSFNGNPVFDGPATNALSHLIHNIMFLASPETTGFMEPVEISGELYRARPIESYDVACMRGTFQSGIRFSVMLTHATEATLPWKIEVRGNNGVARITNNGSRFEAGQEQFEFGDDTPKLLERTYTQYLETIRGIRPRFLTGLADTRGYLLATNGLLVSSGGIHTIPEKWIRRYENDGDTGFDVSDLYKAVEQSFDTGNLFNELQLPWSVKSRPVFTDNLKQIDLSVYK